MTQAAGADLFGRVQLGYIVIESERLDDWKRFAHQGVGLHLDAENESGLAFRIDAHQRRLVINRGPAEDVTTLGIQLLDENTFQLAKEQLQEHGISWEKGSVKAARERGVKSFIGVKGPKGLRIELYCEPLETNAPLKMLCRQGFVTGGSGMGHVAITTRYPTEMIEFWQSIFGARVSDYIVEKIAGMTLDITFLRFNERHHSIAIAATREVAMDPIRTRIQHLNLLAIDLDDLAAAYQRLLKLNFEMAHEIGQHPNDKEISFYVTTPSGFELELGWNALTVDETTWQINHYDGISLWGHKPRRSGVLHSLGINIGNFRRGLRSLFSDEYRPFDA